MPGQLILKRLDHDRGHDRHAHDGAKVVEELPSRIRRAQHAIRKGALHDDGEGGKDGPNADAGHGHRERGLLEGCGGGQARQQKHPDHANPHADDRLHLVASAAGGELPTDQAADHEPEHHGGEDEAGVLRAVTEDALRIQGQEGQCPEERDAHQEAEDDGHGKGTALEEVKRQDRFGDTVLPYRKGDQDNRANDQRADDLHRSPRIRDPGPGQTDQQRQDAGDQEQDADPVDAHAAPAGKARHEIRDQS